MARWSTLTSLLCLTIGFPVVAQSQSYESPQQGVTPAGWQSPGYTQVGHKAKVRSMGPVGPLPAGPGRTIYEQLPDDQGWLYEDTPLERALKETFRHAYFRVDYLNWSVSEPGNNLIGSDTAILGLDALSPNSPNDALYPSDPAEPYIFQPFRDPTTAFQISNPATIGNPMPTTLNELLIAVVQPSLNDVRIDSNNGIRGTFGLPVLNLGTFEASVFMLQNSNSPIIRNPVQQIDVYDSNGNGIIGETFTPLTIGEFDRDGNQLSTEAVPDFEAFAIPILINGAVPQPRLIPAVPGTFSPPIPSVRNPLSPGTQQEVVLDANGNPVLDSNGQPVTVIADIPSRGDNFRIVWDKGYAASLKTSVWGTEGNFLMETFDPNSPVSLRPMFGFRYLRFGEDFRQSGAYTFSTFNAANNSFVSQMVNRKIDATTINNLYGPQVGLRAELVNKWVTFGAQPKVMMGLNTYKANLETENILGPNDVDQFLTQNESTFGVVGDLEVYSRIRITDYMNLMVGYNLMWAGMLTRPYDNIVYNASQTLNDPDGDGVGTYDYASDFKLDVKYSGAILQGLNVGGEIRY